MHNYDDYFGKTLAVYTKDGCTVGEFYGYNYDYDDNGKEFVEFDLLPVGIGEAASYGFGFDEREVLKIKVLD